MAPRTAAELMAEVYQLFREAPVEQLPALLGDLEAAKACGWSRLVTPTRQGEPVEGRNLSAKEAARRLGVSKPYLYKHADEYPFTVRIGKRVVFDCRGLEAWNSGQHRA